MILRAALQRAPRTPPAILVRRGFAVSHHRAWRPSINQNVTISAPKSFASAASADEGMEKLQELSATAKDEFEMAAEETEKNSVYASDDRKAAKEALEQLKDAFEKAVQHSSPTVADEIRGRVSQRIRELDNAYTALEESAQEH